MEDGMLKMTSRFYKSLLFPIIPIILNHAKCDSDCVNDNYLAETETQANKMDFWVGK